MLDGSMHTGQGQNLLYAPAGNEPELGQGFTLSSSRPSQSIPGMILRLVRSGLQITLFIYNRFIILYSSDPLGAAWRLRVPFGTASNERARTLELEERPSLAARARLSAACVEIRRPRPSARARDPDMAWAACESH